jgi:hypothetical protein
MDMGGWLGEVLLLSQDELAGFRDAQDVLLSFVQQNDLALSLHQVNEPNAAPLGPRRPRRWLVRLFCAVDVGLRHSYSPDLAGCRTLRCDHSSATLGR